MRKLRDNTVYDEPRRLKLNEKVDPETNARVTVREDGVLTVRYLDESRLVMFADGTETTVNVPFQPDGVKPVMVIDWPGVSPCAVAVTVPMFGAPAVATIAVTVGNEASASSTMPS